MNYCKFIYNVMTFPSTIFVLWIEAENCRSDIELILTLQDGNDDDDHDADGDYMGKAMEVSVYLFLFYLLP